MGGMIEVSLPPIPNAVRDAHQKGRLAVFVGSGLSLGNGVRGNVPGWNGIAMRLLDLCREFDRGEPDEIEALRTTFRKRPRLEQMLSQLDSVKTLLDRDYQRALTRIFRPQDAHAGAAHQQLVALKPPLILTTNYDLLLEGADPRRTKYTWREANKVKGDIEECHPVLFKVHGTAERADTVILTKGEYEALTREEAYQKVFQWLFQTYTFLFVGYDVNDPLDLDQLMQSSAAAFGPSTGRHFVLWYNPQGSAGRGTIEDHFDRKYNISPIFYTDHQQLPAILAAIAIKENHSTGTASPKGRVLQAPGSIANASAAASVSPRIKQAQFDQLLALATEIFLDSHSGHDARTEALFEAYDVSAPLEPYFRISNTGDAITLLRDMLHKLANATNTRDGGCPILEFVWHLSDEMRMNRLREWIDQVAEDLHLDAASIIKRARNLAEERKKRQRCLIVKIDEEADNAGKHSYSLSAWAVNSTQQGGYRDVRPLHPEDAPPYTLAEIPAQISRYIKEAGSSNDLTIELVVPLSLLSKEFDEWEHRSSLGPALPIGTKFRVVVRSLERLYKVSDDEGILDNWKKRWKQIHSKSVHAPWVCSSKPDNLDDFHLQVCDKGDCHIALGFAVTTTESDKELLGNLIAAGTPIAVWPRRLPQELLGLPDCIDELTSEEHLANWPEAVRKQRVKAFQDPRHLGKHLTLLWDDPDRPPPGALGQGRLTPPVKARTRNHG